MRSSVKLSDIYYNFVIAHFANNDGVAHRQDKVLESTKRSERFELKNEGSESDSNPFGGFTSLSESNKYIIWWKTGQNG